MKLEEKMYIKINGSITKIDHLHTSKKGETYMQFKDPRGILSSMNVKIYNGKSSFNIIDLIEVGDYVNGYKIEEVNNNLNEHKGTCNCLDTYLWCVNDLGKFEEIVIFENEIKSIVTKEQFEQINYKIKGSDK